MRLITILTLVTTMFLLPSCGSSSSAGGPGTGALRVQHRGDSPGIVDKFTVREQVGARSFEVDVNLAPGESHTVTELLSGPYDVDVEWTDNEMKTYMDVIVREGETTEVVVGR